MELKFLNSLWNGGAQKSPNVESLERYIYFYSLSAPQKAFSNVTFQVLKILILSRGNIWSDSDIKGMNS